MVGVLLARSFVDLDSGEKARLLGAFLGALALCVLLMLIVWLGARATRRYMNSPSDPVSTPAPQDEWSMKPMGGGDELESPDADAGNDPGDDSGGDKQGRANG